MRILKLQLNKSNKHFYAQLICPFTGNIFLNGSTLEKKMLNVNYANKVSIEKLALLLSNRLLNTGIDTIIYNQKKYSYHGKVKSFLDILRKQGITFGKESILLKNGFNSK